MEGVGDERDPARWRGQAGRSEAGGVNRLQSRGEQAAEGGKKGPKECDKEGTGGFTRSSDETARPGFAQSEWLAQPRTLSAFQRVCQSRQRLPPRRPAGARCDLRAPVKYPCRARRTGSRGTTQARNGIPSSGVFSRSAGPAPAPLTRTYSVPQSSRHFLVPWSRFLPLC